MRKTRFTCVRPIKRGRLPALKYISTDERADLMRAITFILTQPHGIWTWPWSDDRVRLEDWIIHLAHSEWLICKEAAKAWSKIQTAAGRNWLTTREMEQRAKLLHQTLRITAAMCKRSKAIVAAARAFEDRPQLAPEIMTRAVVASLRDPTACLRILHGLFAEAPGASGLAARDIRLFLQHEALIVTLPSDPTPVELYISPNDMQILHRLGVLLNVPTNGEVLSWILERFFAGCELEARRGTSTAEDPWGAPSS